MLESEQDLDVVGELEGVGGIDAAIEGSRPDVVLLDLELSQMQGVDALRHLREIAPDLKVIVYTSHDEEEYIIQAAELGVDGYLLKGSRHVRFHVLGEIAVGWVTTPIVAGLIAFVSLFILVRAIFL